MVLAGCPLEEKISEMNMVEAQGSTVGALAIAVIDNPMCAATGHRICNDCMKACVYQKQDPVDIPQVETRILKEVLALLADTKHDLLAKISHGQGQTLLREALLVADHNAYHLGQLVFLRKTLEG